VIVGLPKVVVMPCSQPLLDAVGRGRPHPGPRKRLISRAFPWPGQDSNLGATDYENLPRRPNPRSCGLFGALKCGWGRSVLLSSEHISGHGFCAPQARHGRARAESAERPASMIPATTGTRVSYGDDRDASPPRSTAGSSRRLEDDDDPSVAKAIARRVAVGPRKRSRDPGDSSSRRPGRRAHPTEAVSWPRRI
jgi:hypothetical protein